MWLAGSPSCVSELADEVCLPLLWQLAVEAKLEDMECLKFFTEGAPLYDSGAYDGWDEDSIMESNEELLAGLREDEHECELQAIAQQDAALHRMAQPVPASSIVLMDVSLSAACSPLARLPLPLPGAAGPKVWHRPRGQARRVEEDSIHRSFLMVMCCR